jgi:DNA-binding NarL/FixJ family response regulator
MINLVKGEGMLSKKRDLKTRILIADDYAFFRERLRRIISEMYGTIVINEAGKSNDVIDMVRKNDFDLVILDISISGGSGLDIVREIKEMKPALSILVLSMFPEEQYAAGILKEAGAAGYVSKETVPDELINAIGQILQGGMYFNSSLYGEQGGNPEIGHIPEQ